VSVTVPDFVPEVVFTVAVMVEVPVATPVATPVVELIVAALVVPEDHATCAVTFFVELSANVAVAVSCNVDPVFTDAGFGVMSIELRSDVFTITPPVELTPSCEAVIVALPTVDDAVTIPAASTVAEADDDVHFAEFVTSLVLPSTVVPLAVNCFVSPAFRKIDVGETVMLLSELPPTKNPLQLLKTSAKESSNPKSTQLTHGRRADCMLHLCANSTKIGYSACFWVSHSSHTLGGHASLCCSHGVIPTPH
jgi:hypothetical protein